MKYIYYWFRNCDFLLFVRFLCYYYSNYFVLQMFLCFKVSKNDQGQSKGFGFVCFETEQQAENALRFKTNNNKSFKINKPF